jgi:DNA mismatch endonuclease (patch repair protein)
MQTTRQRDTRAELRLRRELHRRGRRFRVDLAPLPGLRRRADIVFTRQRVAIYVDGCFWHACPAHGTIPRHNREWWVAKLEANERRDRDTDRRLAAAGWRVVRVWEHLSAADAADEVERCLADPGH